MNSNEYIPFLSEILDIKKHTDIEYTFKMSFDGESRPGQFFEVSIPKYGEAPISISGIDDGSVDLTIRKVGRVTNEIFENFIGSKLFMRGPYGNGFDVNLYKDKDIIIVAGGTGVSPVRGVIEYFNNNKVDRRSLATIIGFKSEEDILFKSDIDRWKENMNLILTLDASNNPKYNTGLVTKYISELEIDDIDNTVAIIVGPPAMMKFSIAEFDKLGFRDDNIWVSYERKMCCGIGKCGHCRMNDVYICLDGPVFNYVRAKTLID